MDLASLTHRRLSRRRFLAAAVTGVTAALGDILLTDAPWLDYGKQAKRTWNAPLQVEAALSAQIREMVRYATLAPSGHNAQPWRFAVLGSTVRILPDYSRRLPVVDPQDRELWISLGCALENLALAAQYAGWAGKITYPELGADYLTLHLAPSSARNSTRLFEPILHRQNTRSLCDGHAAAIASEIWVCRLNATFPAAARRAVPGIIFETAISETAYAT